MENSQPIVDEDHPEQSTEEFHPEFTTSWQAEQETTDQKRDLKERFFLTRKELRDCQRLLALRDEELHKLRLAERQRVEQTHGDENVKASQVRLQKRVDELQRQLTDSRNQLRQTRTESAERTAIIPLLERETTELREQQEQGEGHLKELTGLLEQRERELQEKNGSLHEIQELSDRLDQREQLLLEREEELHEAREKLRAQQGEIENALQTAEAANGERDELAQKLTQVEESMGIADNTTTMLQEKLMESGEELVKLEESVRDYRYVMETMKREKADLETASSRAVDELEKKVKASNNECEALRELLKVRQQEQEQGIAEKNEMTARLEQTAESHREALASLEETQARAIKELRAESASELTGVLQGHAQEIDKLKMMHAGELGDIRESANRLQQDLELAREESGRRQLELDKAHQSTERLQGELDETRQGIPPLVARIEEREQAITETRTMLVDTLDRLQGLDQPPELVLGQDQPAGQADNEKWPAHQSFGEFLDGIEEENGIGEDSDSPDDFPPTT